MKFENMLMAAVEMDPEALPQRSGWEFANDPLGASLRWRGAPAEAPSEDSLREALESGFGLGPGHASIRVLPPLPRAAGLAYLGGVGSDRGDDAGGAFVVHRDMFYQNARSWSAAPMAFPLRYVLTQGRRHPLRPPKPTGVVYRRYIPWLQKTISFRTVVLDDDLATFNRWMNDPVVARFWQEEGDLAQHRGYLRRIAEDQHTLSLIGCFDDEPFGYFEVYWAKEDRIAPFYEAADHDRGWHALVGEAKYRGKPYLTAWMPSISHYLFLDDCRTQRIVIEPRVDNDKMIKSLARCGYALLKEFDFPHKRAMLGMLLRERFFAEALWWPRD